MATDTIPIRGAYRDVLTGKDDVVIFDSGWHSNTIVQSCRILLAGFMKNDSPSGIQFLAVGRGDESWDRDQSEPTPPAPDPEMSVDLVNPYNPKIPVSDLELIYLDASDQPATVGTVTSRLQIKATLRPGYPPPVEFNAYPLREFGLFGKFNDKPYMINCVRHPVVYKDILATLVREIRLYF